MSRIMRLVACTAALALPTALAWPVLAASPAAAGAVVDRTVAALRSDPVYVDPAAADLLNADAAAQLRSKIQAGGARILIAAEPVDIVNEAGGDPNQVVDTIGRALEQQGIKATVGVLFHNPQGRVSFRAGSSALPRGEALSLASAAFRANQAQGPLAVLTDFVGRVQSAPAGRSAPQPNGSTNAVPVKHSKSTGGTLLLIVVLLVAVAVVVALISTRRRSGGMAGPMAGPGAAPPAGPGYGPGYGGGYPAGGGGGPGFGTGLAAGGLGGFALGEMMGRQSGRDRDDDQPGGYASPQGDPQGAGVQGGGDWGGGADPGGGDFGGDSGGGDFGGGDVGGGDF
ncbi:MAG: hypothetical protein ACYDAD_04445 [Acidimicrobiales bacterium]